MAEYRKPRIDLVCAECGSVFNVMPYKEKKAKYCSKKCKDKNMGKHLTPFPKQEFCKRGHLMSTYRVYCKNGDTLCSKCDRQRTYQYRRDNPEREKLYKRRHKLKKLYGMSINDVEEMIKKQKGSCKICQGTFNTIIRPRVDHDHSNGKIRGILCNRCNTGLGLFRDNETFLSRASSYIKKNKGV